MIVSEGRQVIASVAGRIEEHEFTGAKYALICLANQHSTVSKTIC